LDCDNVGRQLVGLIRHYAVSTASRTKEESAGHMKITHLGHACLLVETDDARILIDPGTYTAGFDDILDIDAVLITHKHDDHFDRGGVQRLLGANSEATLIVESAAAGTIAEWKHRWTVRPVIAGDTFMINATEITAVGGVHKPLHPEIDFGTNVGYFFTQSGLLHPGDDLAIVPGVQILALPVSGPWQGLSEVVDYLRAVGPLIAFPMHEAILAEPPMYYSFIDKLKPAGTVWTVLEPGVATDIAAELAARTSLDRTRRRRRQTQNFDEDEVMN
jgi:L-ascorbate metabolism protein UlaG (beta-lactamase superfamily)